jgi:hypothetical protein
MDIPALGSRVVAKSPVEESGFLLSMDHGIIPLSALGLFESM